MEDQTANRSDTPKKERDIDLQHYTLDAQEMGWVLYIMETHVGAKYRMMMFVRPTTAMVHSHSSRDEKFDTARRRSLRGL